MDHASYFCYKIMGVQLFEKGETLPKKDRKKRGVANKKCKDNIIAGLNTLEKYHNFDKFLEKQILKNQDCDIVSWNGNC